MSEMRDPHAVQVSAVLPSPKSGSVTLLGNNLNGDRILWSHQDCIRQLARKETRTSLEVPLFTSEKGKKIITRLKVVNNCYLLLLIKDLANV